MVAIIETKADCEKAIGVYKKMLGDWNELVRDAIISQSEADYQTSQIRAYLEEMEKLLVTIENQEYDEERALGEENHKVSRLV